MKVSQISTKPVNMSSSVSFKRLRTPAEEIEFQQLKNDVLEISKTPQNFIFIVQEPSLPVNPAKNIGVGFLTSDEGKEFVNYIKQNTFSNIWEELPFGEQRGNDGMYIPFGASETSIGAHKINPELLTKPEFGNILTPKDFQELVDANKMENKEKLINFENIYDRNCPQETAMKKAWERFKKLDDASPLKKEFSAFLETPRVKDLYERRAIFNVLEYVYDTTDYTKWTNEVDKNLYNPEYNNTQTYTRKKQILKEHADDIQLYKFKQFLAKKHHMIGKKILNDAGFLYQGDPGIGFDTCEYWAYPKAFSENKFIGDINWELRALDYDKLHDPLSDASKLMDEKFRFYLEHYDSLRVDVGWSYAKPYIASTDGSPSQSKDMGDVLFKRIEKIAKEVKGDDYDMRKILYEVEAGSEFSMFENNYQIPAFQNRSKIYTSYWMNDNWANKKAFEETFHFPLDEIYFGSGNHDTRPLVQLATGIDPLNQGNISEMHSLKEQQVHVLGRELNKSPEEIRSAENFIRAKHTQGLGFKNSLLFMLDFFGRNDRFDSQELNTPENYRNKLDYNFAKAHNDSVVKGHGYNLPDVCAMLFESKGWDKEHPFVYEKLQKFAKIAKEAEAKAEEALSDTTEQIVKKGSKSKQGAVVSLVAAGVLGGLYLLWNPPKKKKP